MNDSQKRLFDISDRKSTVLVVDDNSAQRKAIEGLLELRDYQCFGVASGADALSTLEKHEDAIDACLLDLQLEGSDISGLDTLRRIRRTNQSLPILGFTAYHADEVATANAVAAGATLFVRRPFEPHDLCTAVDALVSMGRLAHKVAVSDRERELLQRAINAMAVEVMIVDEEGQVVMMNDCKRRAHGIRNDGSAERKCWELGCGSKEVCKECIPRGGGDPVGPFMRELTVGGRTLLVHTEPLQADQGKPTYYVQTGVDTTRRKKAIDLIRLLPKWATLAPEAIAETVATFLHEELGYSRVRFYVNEGDTPKGTTARGMGPGFDMTKYALGEDDESAMAAFKVGHPIITDGDKLPRNWCYNEFAKDGVQHQLQVPLVSGAGKMGVMTLDDKNAERPISREDVDLMELVAPAIADAIQASRQLRDQQRQHRDQERRLEWLTCLDKVDAALTTIPRVDHALSAVVCNLVENFKEADAGIVMRRDAGSNGAGLHTVATSAGLIDQGLSTARHPGTHGLIGESLSQNRPVFSEDVWKDDKFLRCVEAIPEGTPWRNFVRAICAVAIVPVRCGTQPIGVLLLRFPKKHAFAEMDKQFLNQAVARIAIALAKLDDAQCTEAALIQQAKLSDLALLTAGVAHGIKNPLTIVRSSVELARRQLRKSAAGCEALEQADPLADVEEHLQRVFDTIERLRKWARPQGLEPDLISIVESLEDLGELVRQEFAHRNISLRIDAGPDIPNVWVPPDGLRMALVDLFWNAAKAMPDGGQLDVTVRPAKDVPEVMVEIHDTGRGMRRSEVERLFAHNPFDPIPPGGTGLGLYLCRKVLETVGGRIKCDSTEGMGTTFTIHLPTSVERQEDVRNG